MWFVKALHHLELRHDRLAAYLEKVALLMSTGKANLKTFSLGPPGLGHICNSYYFLHVGEGYRHRVGISTQGKKVFVHVKAIQKQENETNRTARPDQRQPLSQFQLTGPFDF